MIKYLDGFLEGLAPVKSEGRCYFIDHNGNKSLETKYKNVGQFHEGLATITDYKDRIGYINKNGEVIIKPQFKFARNFSCGLASVREFNSNKSGYINEFGKFVIMPKYDFAFDFQNEYAVVEIEDSYGLIDQLGKYVIEPIYGNLKSVTEHLVVFSTRNHKGGFLNTKGEKVLELNGYRNGFIDDFHNRHIVSHKSDGKGFTQCVELLDKTGKPVLTGFDELKYLGNNLYSYSNISHWDRTDCRRLGIIDVEGNIVSKELFSRINKFYDDLAIVQYGHKSYLEKYGVVNIQGEWVIDPIIPRCLHDFSEGLALIDGYGFVDKTGTFIIGEQKGKNVNEVFGKVEHESIPKEYYLMNETITNKVQQLTLLTKIVFEMLDHKKYEGAINFILDHKSNETTEESLEKCGVTYDNILLHMVLGEDYDMDIKIVEMVRECFNNNVPPEFCIIALSSDIQKQQK